MNFTTPIIVAVITAGAGLIASALSFFLTKMKEREAEWRTQKLNHYKAFMVALNAIVGPPAPTEDRVRFADAANNLFLFGSKDVLVALRDFLDVTADSRTQADVDRHDELLTKLIIAIRMDIGIKGAPLPDGFEFRLWLGRSRQP
jgi:hypothetical protein